MKSHESWDQDEPSQPVKRRQVDKDNSKIIHLINLMLLTEFEDKMTKKLITWSKRPPKENIQVFKLKSTNSNGKRESKETGLGRDDESVKPKFLNASHDCKVAQLSVE